MGFELNVASMRDPSEQHAALRASSVPASAYTAVKLNGTLDDAASLAIVDAVSGLAAVNAHSILVHMEDVEAASVPCLDAFAAHVMSLRSGGANVQVSARHAALHDMLARAPDSRDWLLHYAAGEDPGPRSGIHVDGPGRT